MMEAAGVGLAIVATIDLCLKYGARVVEACNTYKHADSIMREKALRVEVCWYRARMQMLYVREAWKDFDQELTDLQSRMFDILEGKLKGINRRFDKLHNSQLRIEKWKLVTKEECLEEAIEELEKWLVSFDPSWMFILKAVSRTSATQEQSVLAAAHVPKDDARTARDLRHALQPSRTQSNPIWLPNERLMQAKKFPIKHSSAHWVQEPQDGKSYVVEALVYGPGTETNTATKNIKTIVSKIQSIDSLRFGMLQCKGVIREKREEAMTTFDLVYRQPPGFKTQPTSFRTLINTDIEHSLTERLQVAQQLARAVCYIHSLDFVHKNVRPESILAFNQEGGSKLGSVFLVGFQRFRAADGRTQLHEQSSWDIDLYRHPERQGDHPEKEYIMQHDIYSLGACLLEIGLWSSFVIFTNDEDTHNPGSILDVPVDLFHNPETVKERLIDMAQTLLPYKIGDKFAEIVVNCLTCLDADNPHFADHSEFEDADGILIGVKYIEKILLELESISL